ncbi:MAG: NAD(P)H-hydrate dehydratase [Clostridia bacterium]|nr:NAD(P)H-hydrate dehydratase [Clostridia bacterium]
MRLLSSDEMKQVEQYTAKFGLSYQRMMENAGAACARNIRNIIEKNGSGAKTVAVVCGKGNNGGDGFVVARKFAENGYNVSVVLAAGYPMGQEAVYMYKMVIDLAIPTVWYDADRLRSIQTIKSADIVVDAVFGFGFYGEVPGPLAELFNEISAAPGLKFSVDIPSGVYCDSGFCANACVKADYTVAISALKPAHIIHPACDCCGDIIVANIGIPDESFAVCENSMYTYSFNEVKALFSKRVVTGNKGDFGRVLCICGSRNMVGAAVLSAKAALRSGAGLVQVAFPDCAYAPVASQLTETLLLPLNSNLQGTLSVSCIPVLLEEMKKADAILIGCGLGISADTREIVRAVIENADCPVVADADALNIIAEEHDIIARASSPLIFTPHPGEMARLTGISINAVQTDRLGVASSYAAENRLTLILKGSNTLVACGANSPVFVNSTGNSGMAKGGSGDMLAGLVAGFTAQKMPVRDACTAAVYIHGYTGENVSDKLSLRGMLPSDMINELPYILKDFEN